MKKLLIPASLILVLILSLALVACSSSTPTSTTPAAPATSAAPTTSVPPSTSAVPPTSSAPTTSAPPASSTTPEAKTLNIGEIESLTGMFSDFMKYVPQGGKLAADLINSQGGITINGQQYKINLIVEDNKSTPDGAQTAASDLIFDKHVSFIFGTGPTPLVIAIDQTTEPNGVLYTGIYQERYPG